MKSCLLVLSALLSMLALTACGQPPSQEATATTPEPAPAVAVAESSAKTAPPASNVVEAPKAVVTPKPPAKKAAEVTEPAKAAPQMVEIPQGTAINIFLTDPISTAKNKAGDTFTASLADPIVVNGETAAARGATVKGRIIDAEGSGRVRGAATIQMELTSIVAGGKSYPISTRPYSADADSTKKRDAGVIAGGGGLGAAIGALAGGKKGAVKGAIIGGAAGTGAVLVTKGKEVEFDSETRLSFALEKATELPKIR